MGMAMAMGWTPPRWWQWWRRHDTRVEGIRPQWLVWQWALAPARWWQVWLPQSGPLGGLILGYALYWLIRLADTVIEGGKQ